MYDTFECIIFPVLLLKVQLLKVMVDFFALVTELKVFLEKIEVLIMISENSSFVSNVSIKLAHTILRIRQLRRSILELSILINPLK